MAPQTAMLKAQRAIGGNTNLGSYLAPNQAHLQQVQGHWYYIVDLRVTSWRGFRTRGTVIPAYVVVDAMNPQAEAELRTGYQMRYVPDARWNLDLDRYVYLNFLLHHRWLVDDLRTLEVDNEWNPYYTGTLLRHEIGWRGKMVDGVITVDPQTGEINQYGLDEVPDWIDRIWSISLTEDYAHWWGMHHEWDACRFQGTAGQRRVDQVNDVVTSEGLAFQVTMTSVGTDQSLTEIIYVNPRTGDATLYPLTGATVQAVDNLIDEATREVTAEGYEPVECELQMLLGRQVWYCILTGRGGGNDESSGSYAGVAFIQARHSSDNTQVIIDETLQGAYDQLRHQIALEATDDPTLGETQQLLQIEGVVQQKSLWTTQEGQQYYLFSVITDGEVTYYFQVGAHDITAAWMQPGDTVTVTYYESAVSDFLSVVNIQIRGGPTSGQ